MHLPDARVLAHDPEAGPLAQSLHGLVFGEDGGLQRSDAVGRFSITGEGLSMWGLMLSGSAELVVQPSATR